MLSQKDRANQVFIANPLLNNQLSQIRDNYL